MFYILERYKNNGTPLIPIFIAATAVGTAASVAGLGLQGAQYAELVRQLPDQKKLLALEIKLAQHQLDQYTESHKQPGMIIRGPSNIPRPPTFSAMTTRSMER